MACWPEYRNQIVREVCLIAFDDAVAKDEHAHKLCLVGHAHLEAHWHMVLGKHITLDPELVSRVCRA